MINQVVSQLSILREYIRVKNQVVSQPYIFQVYIYMYNNENQVVSQLYILRGYIITKIRFCLNRIMGLTQ